MSEKRADGPAQHGSAAEATGVTDPTFGTEFVMQRESVSVHFWRRGNTNARPVVLTHGAGMDHRMFEPQLPALDAYQVVTWDVRGHGASRPRGRAPLTADAVLQDLFALLDVCELDHPIVAGQSMGGNVSQALVSRRPQRASALIVIDSARNTQPRKLSERMMLPLTGPSLSIWPYRNLKRLSVKGSADTATARVYMQGALDAIDKQDFVHATVAATQFLHPDPSYAVPVPLLVLCGVDDKLGSIAKDFRAWRAAEPDATVLQVPAASHLSNLDNPAFVNRAILEFLERLPP